MEQALEQDEWVRDVKALELMRRVDPTLTKRRLRARAADGSFLFAPAIERRQFSRGSFIWVRLSQVHAWMEATKLALEQPIRPAMVADESTVMSFKRRGGAFAKTAALLEQFSS